MRLAKYDWVRIAAPCPAQAELRRALAPRARDPLQHITVTRHSDGHWYATLTFARQAPRVPVEQRTAPPAWSSGSTAG